MSSAEKTFINDVDDAKKLINEHNEKLKKELTDKFIKLQDEINNAGFRIIILQTMVDGIVTNNSIMIVEK